MAKHAHFSLFARPRRHSDERLAQHLTADLDAVLILRNGEVGAVNHRVRDLLGWEPELCPGRTLSELFGVDAYARLDELQTAAETAGGHHATIRGIALEGVDGTLWADVTIADHRHDASVAGTVVTIHDARDRVAVEQRIRQVEHHDPLTRTANATMFDQLVVSALASGSPVGLAVVVLPTLADTAAEHGSAVADAALLDLTNRLGSVLRTGDHLGRLGPTQFALLIHHLNDEDPDTDLDEVKQRLRLVLEAPILVGETKLRLQAVVQAAHNQPGDGMLSLMQRTMSQPQLAIEAID